MTRILLVHLFLFFTVIGNGQELDTLFFNKKWEQVPSGKPYKYAWILNSSIDLLGTPQSHFENGLLRMKGVFNSLEHKTKTGKYISYKKDGTQKESIQFNYETSNDTIKTHLLNKYKHLRQLDSITVAYIEFSKWNNFVSGLKVNDLAYGTWTYRNKNKEISETIEYENDKKNGYSVVYYNSDDKVQKSDYGKVWQTGRYKNGELDGKWTFYEPDNTIYREIIYEEGKKKEDKKYWKN